jgi:hypothetical protein
VVTVDLLPLGAPRRDWRATSLSDGVVVVRHRELSKSIEMAGRRRPPPVRRSGRVTMPQALRPVMPGLATQPDAP